MAHPFKHLRVVLHHRHLVIYNGFHLGIGFHCLKHDLSKFSKTEFGLSSKFFQGTMSPVFAERKAHGYYSEIAKHHTGRNMHHWEYWCDLFIGNLVIKTMPYKYALEYIADVLSASKTYDPKGFTSASGYDYVSKKIDRYYMTKATKEFILWCLLQYKNYGFKGLKKKDTYKKYQEITAKYPNVEIYKINLGPSEIKEGEHD
jgi:hypothetical protein